jgi:hypothetical protein
MRLARLNGSTNHLSTVKLHSDLRFQGVALLLATIQQFAQQSGTIVRVVSLDGDEAVLPRPT